MAIPLPLFELLEASAAGVSSLAGAKGLIDAILGLRAKKRARNALSTRIKSDPALKELIQRRANKTLTPQQVKLINEMILKSIVDLSRNDQKRVAAGLTQINRQAEIRYMDNLLELV